MRWVTRDSEVVCELEPERDAETDAGMESETETDCEATETTAGEAARCIGAASACVSIAIALWPFGGCTETTAAALAEVGTLSVCVFVFASASSLAFFSGVGGLCSSEDGARGQLHHAVAAKAVTTI